MCLTRIEAAQIFVIVFVEELKLVVDKPRVFLLKDLLEDALYLVTVGVITAVFRHFVDEEQRQAFDAELEQFALTLEVSLDGLANLNALQMQFIGISNHFTLADSLAVGKGNIPHRLCIIAGEDFGDSEVAVFEQLV